MPIIPTYKEQERFKNVSATHTQKFNVPPPVSDASSTKIIVDNGSAEFNQLSELSDLGKNLQKWGNGLAQFDKQRQLTSAIDNFTALKQDPELQDKLYGENGLFTQKGEASFDAPEQFKHLAQEYGQKYSEKVQGELGTSYFNAQLENYIGNYSEKAVAHASNEYTAWQLQAYTKASSFAFEEAINNYDDPNLFKNSLAQAMFNTKLAGQFSGLSEENINNNIKEIASKSYLGVANKFLEQGNTNEAARVLASGMLSEDDNYSLTNTVHQLQKKEISDVRKAEYVTKTTNNIKLKTLSDNLNTSLKYASTTGDTSNIVALSKQYKDLGDFKSSKSIEKQAKIIDANYELIMTLNEQKLPEKMQTLKYLENELNKHIGKKNSKSYHMLEQKKQLIELNIKDFESLLKNDPAKAVKVDIQGSAYEVARQRLDEQRDNGLSMQNAKILTKDEATDMANLWEDAALDERSSIMENLKAYGSYAPKVANELGLDFMEQLGLSHLNENNRYLPSLKRIISANSAKNGELLALENVDVLKAEVYANSKVYETYANMATLNSDNKILSNNVNQLQKSIANILHQNNGNVVRTVQLIDGELDSINNAKMNVLLYSTKIDKDVVENGLNNALGQDLENFLTEDLLNNQADKHKYLANLREKAVWQSDFIINEYVLIDTKSGEPVKNAKGVTFSKTNEDLLVLDL